MKLQYSEKRNPIRQYATEHFTIGVKRVKNQRKASVPHKGDSSFMQKVYSEKKKVLSPSKKCPSPTKQSQPLMRCSTIATNQIKPDPQFSKKQNS